MNLLSDWTALAQQGIPLVAIDSHPTDKPHLLQQFHQWGEAQSLPVYFWNPGYATLQQVITQDDRAVLQPLDSMQPTADVIQTLLETGRSGIYLLEGVLESDATGQLSPHRLYQLINAHHHLRWSTDRQYWILLEEQIQLPLKLQPFIPVLTHPLPDLEQIQAIAFECCDRHLSSNISSQAELIRACQGLPIGELQLVLERSLPFAESIEALVAQVLQYKKSKLRGRGLELISEPDVPKAAGMEQLSDRLERISALLEPEATQYGLSFPKGMILWGAPGTGKSLAAKLAAQKLGVPLLAADWGALPGTTAYESEQNLRFLLQTAESMAPICLYFDDFDKGFAGWNSDDDGAVIQRQAGKFLTWMQEHQSAVFVMATVNRLGTLPVELQRRVEDIFFVDLPHDGARYEVFNLHLVQEGRS